MSSSATSQGRSAVGESVLPYVLSGVMLCIIVVLAVRLRFRQSAIISEFEDQFPGRCGICAFYEFGIREGKYERGTVPEDHRCREGFRRFRGVLH